MIQYFCGKAKHHLRALILSDTEKYRAILPLGMVDYDSSKNDFEKLDILRDSEPLDYFNLVNTYTMFLQYVSI
jgi:hypothetical protein